jgi:hypothetical protein
MENFDDALYAPRDWGGCVEGRYQNGLDETEDAPGSGPLTRFQPFYWASTLLQPDGTQPVDAQGRPIPGDNDWIRAIAGVSNSAFAITEQWRAARENYSVGPSLGCPETPILSLSPSRTAVLAAIASLRSTNRGGTMANLGLQFGWFAISPQWKGLWGDPTPANRPVDYGTPFTDKVIVLMTDGQNEWYDFPGGAPGACSDTNINSGPASGLNRLPGVANINIPPFRLNACPPGYTAPTNNADYSGYGRLAEGRLGVTTNAQAVPRLNERTARLCENIKAQGIILYTITFNLTNVTTQNLFRACATAPEFYFNSPNQAALQAAFRTIGTQLVNLRLTR